MAEGFARFERFPHWRLQDWRPNFPPGRLDRIYLHWSGGDYASVHPAYHYCVAYDDASVYVVQTNDLRANMRDVYASDAPYAAHTYRRNSFAAGVSVMGMQGASPSDFGRYPLREEMLDALCVVAARVAAAYGIALDAIRTHAEAALEDGYFGAGGDDERWDIGRLQPSPATLRPEEARETGQALRERIARAMPR